MRLVINPLTGKFDTIGIKGPVTSTDNGLLRFDGLTGDVAQNSSATISDTGELTVNTTTNSTTGFNVLNDAGGDILVVNTTDCSGGGTQRILKVRANADSDIDPTANVRGFDYRQKLGGAGTNTAGGRSTNFLMVCRNGMVATGVDGSSLRAQSAGFNWASTGALAEGNGMNTTAFVGGGNTVNAGTATLLVGNRIRVGFQGSAGSGDGSTPIDGTITQAIGFDVLSPNDVSSGGSHTITTLQGLRIQDQKVTDVTNSYAIDIEDQSTGGFVLRAGTGSTLFQDKVSIGEVDVMTINGATTSTMFEVHYEGDGLSSEIEMHRHNDISASGSVFYGARSRGTEGAPTIVLDNDDLMTVAAVGYDGTDYALSSRIDFEVDGTPGSNDMPGRIAFKTSPDGTQEPTEKLRISESSVTINNDKADYDFTIHGDTEDNLLFADASTNAMAMLTDTTQYQINGSTITPTLTMKRLDSGNAINQFLYSDANTATRGAFNVFGRSRNSGGTPIAVVDGDRIGIFRFDSHDGTQFITGASIQSSIDGTVSTGIVPSNLVFRTMDSTGTLATRLYMDSDGLLRVRGGGTDQVILYPEGGITVNQQGNSDALSDLRVESTSYANMFRVDASADEVNIGTATQGAIASFGDSDIVFNETALDIDFRVEGLTDQNLIRTDAGNDRVYVGTSDVFYDKKFNVRDSGTGFTTQATFANANAVAGDTAGFNLEAGSNGAWAISFVTNKSRGWMEIRSSLSAIQHRWHAKDYELADTGIIGWDSTATFSGAGVTNRDLGIARDSASTLEINNGTAGSYADLLLRGLTTSGARHVGRTDVNATPYNVAANDQHISHSYSGTGASSVVLPAIAASNDGREVTIADAGYNAAANVITVNITGADTIGNAATFPINTSGGAITVRANNTTKDWEII